MLKSVCTLWKKPHYHVPFFAAHESKAKNNV